jgi:hypothetical protein
MPARTAFILALLSAPCRGSEPAAQAASVVRRRPFLAQVASRRDAHGGSGRGFHRRSNRSRRFHKRQLSQRRLEWSIGRHNPNVMSWRSKKRQIIEGDAFSPRVRSRRPQISLSVSSGSRR